MDGPQSSGNGGGDLPSDPMPYTESLAQAVARAGSGITNSALAYQAGMSTRTLRAILDPLSTRRFGRATLDKLDEPLGWPTGRAWQMYRRQHHPAEGADDYADSIQSQMEAMRDKFSQFERVPPWAKDLIDAAAALSPEDRAQLVMLAHRLGRR